MIISVDFDGTICEAGCWPEIGKPVPGAHQALRELRKAGHKIIINSCRCGAAEREMIMWLAVNKYPYDAVNENLPERIEQYGGDSRKISADLYIDDKGMYCHIDWPAIVDTISRMEEAE